MFKIYYYNSDTETRQLVYSPETKSTGIALDGNIVQNINSIPTFGIELMTSSPFYNRFGTLKDEIAVAIEYDFMYYSNVIFRGRIQTIVESYNEDGTLTKKITFEGIEACFNDKLIDSTFIPVSSKWSDILAKLNPNKYNINGLYYYGLETGQTPGEYAEQIGRSYREVIDSLFKNTEYNLFSFHKFDSNAEDKLVTDFEVFKIGTDTKHRFILGKHAKSIKITKKYDKLVNKVTIEGDLGLTSLQVNNTSVVSNTEIQLYKKDDRFKIQGSLDNYAIDLLNSQKEPQVSVEMEYIDYDHLKMKQPPQIIYFTERVEVLNPKGELIYEGYISEIKYNLFEPYAKTIILGNKEKLFKESDI